jgi:prephenate dehydratase
MMRIAYLGPEATVSHEAAAYIFSGTRFELIPYRWISDVCDATASGETDLSVIPIENTIDGSVNPHLDYWLEQDDLPIQAEWTYPSVQNLIGVPAGEAEGALERIRHVVSIPVAIAQCQKFLKKHLPGVEFIHVSSTAEGVRFVSEKRDPAYAAIGTATAAAKYGLAILARNITDHGNNLTRFIAVGKKKPEGLPPTDRVKTTMLVTLPEDYPGALHQLLSAFAWRRINLSKLESRPTKRKLGSYYFYIDVEASLESMLLRFAIEEIEAIGCHVRLLGSYPSYPYREGEGGG